MTLSSSSIHECDKCTFVASRENIFVNRETMGQISNKPFFLGIFTMPGWSGHSPFYIFQCRSCNYVSVDYPHGYTNFGLLYLKCQNPHCKESLELCPNKNRTVYELVGGEIPSASRRQRMQGFERATAEAGLRPTRHSGVFVKGAASHLAKKSFFESIAASVKKFCGHSKS